MENLVEEVKIRGEKLGVSNNDGKKFVAINYITCKDEYKERFEQLFSTRAKAIDRMPGFLEMEVLKPMGDGSVYLIVSHWDSADAFKNWTKSPEFIEGHKRGFEDIRKYKEEGKEPPMSSDFKTYEVISN
ncbi:MAG: antibiotic biosynthesis monooxygenase [Ignavibacteria bacterium]|nr:antibiotic biosynthesis monooxygenase [Ignavibacteria bacterium]